MRSGWLGGGLDVFRAISISSLFLLVGLADNQIWLCLDGDLGRTEGRGCGVFPCFLSYFALLCSAWVAGWDLRDGREGRVGAG